MSDWSWADAGSIGSFTVAPPKRGHYVYVAWGHDRTRPLYVGRAVNLWRRIEQHAQWKAPWIAELVELEVHEFESERWAKSAELDAIHALDPIYNQQRWTNLRRLRRSA